MIADVAVGRVHRDVGDHPLPRELLTGKILNQPFALLLVQLVGKGNEHIARRLPVLLPLKRPSSNG
jgi:hypothetical protein